MKRFKSISLQQIKQIGCVSIIFIIVILILSIGFFSSCSTTEYLTEPNNNDRIIVGYNKNMTKYKVVNQQGKKKTRVREVGTNLKPIGGILIANERD